MLTRRDFIETGLAGTAAASAGQLENDAGNGPENDSIPWFRRGARPTSPSAIRSGTTSRGGVSIGNALRFRASLSMPVELLRIIPASSRCSIEPSFSTGAICLEN